MMDKKERWELERLLDRVYQQTDLLGKVRQGAKLERQDIEAIKDSLDILSGYIAEQTRDDDAAIAAAERGEIEPVTPLEDEPCAEQHEENPPSPSAAPIPSGPGSTNSSAPSAPKKAKTKT